MAAWSGILIPCGTGVEQRKPSGCGLPAVGFAGGLAICRFHGQQSRHADQRLRNICEGPRSVSALQRCFQGVSEEAIRQGPVVGTTSLTLAFCT